MANCITRIIPNTLTSCNLISGCIAVTYALGGRPEIALAFIIVGAVFDFFDGMSARLLKVSSPIGKELDSLADDVTFGVAPASMVFNLLMVTEYPSFMEFARPVLPFFAFVIAAFSALRLAKFNLDERQTSSFIGLPTPANALFWGSLIAGGQNFIESTPSIFYFILLMIVVSSYLLIAELPMFALKFKTWGWKGNEIKYIFLITCIPMLFILRLSSFAAIIAWYVILSVINNKSKK